MARRKRTKKYHAPVSLPATQATPQREIRITYSHKVQGFWPHQEKKPKARFKTLYIVIIAVLAAVFVYASIQVIIYLTQSQQAKQEEHMIQALIAQSEAEETQAATAAPAAAQTEIPVMSPVPDHPFQLRDSYQAADPPEVLIQFTKALSINSDTVGRLQMGESINTYVVQRDNSYYLRRSFMGEYSFSGAIFLDATCSIYPQSRNLILHGHNMQDGTAFGKLNRFEDIDYLNKYPFIEFATLYETSRYIPFAVVYYSVDPASDQYLDIYQINSMTTHAFIQFVSKVQLLSECQIPVYIAGTDNILTVTTCASGDDDTRFALFAVKRN